MDLKRLGDKHGDTDFLTSLVRKEMTPAPQDHPDALVFAGPKILLDANPTEEALKDASEIDFPVFYMNYNLNPQAVPWKDAISHTVHFFRGYEYTISRPRDLWFAVSEMVSKIVKSRNGRSAVVHLKPVGVNAYNLVWLISTGSGCSVWHNPGVRPGPALWPAARQALHQ